MLLRRSALPQKRKYSTMATENQDQATPSSLLSKQSSYRPIAQLQEPPNPQPKIEKFSTRSSQQQKELDVMKENELLREAVRLRDAEINFLKIALANNQSSSSQQASRINTQSQQFSSHDPFQLICRQQLTNNTVLELTQELEQIKTKYIESCNTIASLEAKLRHAMSQAQLNEQQLKDQVESLSCDIKYQQQEYSRLVDNLRIQFEQKLLSRLKVQEERYKKEKTLLQEQVSALKMEISYKSLETKRVNDKLRTQKEHHQSQQKYLEHQQQQLLKRIEQQQTHLQNIYKLKEDQLINQFNKDIDNIHLEQKRQIQILCKRIDTLKRLLDEKETFVKQLWKARDIQAINLYGDQATRLATAPTRNQPAKVSLDCIYERKSPELRQKKQLTSFKDKHMDLPALENYMKSLK